MWAAMVYGNFGGSGQGFALASQRVEDAGGAGHADPRSFFQHDSKIELHLTYDDAHCILLHLSQQPRAYIH